MGNLRQPQHPAHRTLLFLFSFPKDKKVLDSILQNKRKQQHWNAMLMSLWIILIRLLRWSWAVKPNSPIDEISSLRKLNDIELALKQQVDDAPADDNKLEKQRADQIQISISKLIT